MVSGPLVEPLHLTCLDTWRLRNMQGHKDGRVLVKNHFVTIRLAATASPNTRCALIPKRELLTRAHPRTRRHIRPPAHPPIHGCYCAQAAAPILINNNSTSPPPVSSNQQKPGGCNPPQKLYIYYTRSMPENEGGGAFELAAHLWRAW